MEKRILGKTGEKLSIVGFGGMVVNDEGSSGARRFVSDAIDRGINYFDVAPAYGNAEERLGPALEPYRSSVFLSCKTTQRTKDKADEDLKRSLKLLRTDYFDLYQLHSVGTLEEADRVMGEGGAIETLLEARENGRVRYLGFSAHTEEVALALLDRFEFDTVLFPINWVCWHQHGLGPRVMEKAKEKGVGILALKSLAKRNLGKGEARKWPKCWYYPVDTPWEGSMALRFTLSREVTAAVAPGHAELLRWACEAASKFKPLSSEEELELEGWSDGLSMVFPLKW